MGMAAMGLALTACNNDETVEVAKGNAIGFNTFVNNSTRATDANNDNFTSFKVRGLINKGEQTGTPFVGVDVTKAEGAWSYGTPVYWEKGYSYSFVALAPNDAYTFTAPTVINTWGSLTFDNKTGETDLLYATQKQGTVEGNTCPPAVNMTFNHMLSRVRFQFKNGMDDGSKLTVTDVKITDAYTNGTATLAENLNALTWTTETTTGNLAFDNAETVGFAQSEFCTTGHKYMIPAEKAYNVTFTVTREYNGVTDSYNHKVTLPVTTMTQGLSYQFVAEFTSNNIDPDNELCPIKFTATVNDWKTFDNNSFNLK